MTGGELSYFPSRGAIYKVDGDGIHKYEVQPETPFDNGTPEKGITIFTGYTLNEQEIVSKNACLNDQRVMYTFGKGFGNIVITGEMLLGIPENQGDKEQELSTYYESWRVHSKKDEPLTLSGPNGFSKEFYLVGMTVTNYNVAMEILGFRLTGILAE